MNTTRLVIGQEKIPGTFPNVLTFGLSGMDALHSLIIGDSCFQNIRSVSFPSMKEFVVGDDSFGKVSDVVLSVFLIGLIMNRRRIDSNSYRITIIH